MYSTQVYLYTPRQIVVLYDGTSPRRYQTVYAKPLTLHKGVDNVIQFQFINQDEKPVDITTAVTEPNQISFRFISYDGTTVLLEKSLVPAWTGNTTNVNLNGILELRVTSAEIENIDPQDGSYSLELPKQIRGNATSGTSFTTFNVPVFVDAMAGARGKLSIVDSVLPSFIPSMNITIPSHTTPSPNNSVTFYTSEVSTNENPVVSFQSTYTNYVGNVTYQGSTTGDDWYDIGNVYNYANSTTTEGVTFNGFHPYMRMKFVSTGGIVGNVLVR